MVQTMWIVVMLNVERFTSANIGYIFRYDMCEGREIASCAAVPWPCTLCSVWCPLSMWKLVHDLQCLSFKSRLKWAQGEVAEGFSEGSSKLQTTAPALLSLDLLGILQLPYGMRDAEKELA